MVETLEASNHLEIQTDNAIMNMYQSTCDKVNNYDSYNGVHQIELIIL